MNDGMASQLIDAIRKLNQSVADLSQVTEDGFANLVREINEIRRQMPDTDVAKRRARKSAGDGETDIERVLHEIRREGRMSHQDVLRRFRSIRTGELKDIIARLVEDGSIEVQEVSTKGRKRVDYVPVASS